MPPDSARACGTTIGLRVGSGETEEQRFGLVGAAVCGGERRGVLASFAARAGSVSARLGE